jgi:hypothetical protein
MRGSSIKKKADRGANMNHIIFTSGGIASLAVCDWVKEQYPSDNILMYFTDTLWESEDLYRFINESSDKLKLPLLTHSLGINPMQLMFEKKMVYNSMIGDCSKLLKMKVARDYLKKGEVPPMETWRNKEYLKNEDFTTDVILYFGIGYEEMHRQDAIIENWKPFKVEMPLIDNNIWKEEVLTKYDIKQPVLYDLGFSHNNCNGRCVKAGQGHYKLLQEQMPKVFTKLLEQEHHLKICVSAYRYITKGNKAKDDILEGDIIPIEAQEGLLAELDDAYRDYFYDKAKKPKIYIHPAGSAVHKYMSIQQYSFMKKDSKPYPLRDFKDDNQSDQIDMFDIGGCGCFIDSHKIGG